MLRKLIRKSSAVAGLALFLAAQPAHAITTLKKVQVTDGSRIDLFFDGKVNPGQIHTDYLKDIIQLSLEGVSVYPAKISSISGTDLTKVFAYQYTPRLVRCRLSVKGKAASYKGRVQVKADGKVVSVRIRPLHADQITASAAGIARSGSSAEAAQGSAPHGATTQAIATDPQERALLDRVLKGGAPAAAGGADKKEHAQEEHPLTREGERAEAEGAIAGATPMPSPLRAIAMLALVLGVFLGFAFILKKARQPDIRSHKGYSGLLGKFAKLGLGKPRMVEVIQTHYLGPKKSISVVKIAGRTLVLGITNESINLITELSELNDERGLDSIGEELAIESDLERKPRAPTAPQTQPGPRAAASSEPALGTPARPANVTSAGTGATAAGPPVFSDLLSQERSRPSVRAQIRSRVEGMKQL